MAFSIFCIPHTLFQASVPSLLFAYSNFINLVALGWTFSFSGLVTRTMPDGNLAKHFLLLDINLEIMGNLAWFCMDAYTIIFMIITKSSWTQFFMVRQTWLVLNFKFWTDFCLSLFSGINALFSVDPVNHYIFLMGLSETDL